MTEQARPSASRWLAVLGFAALAFVFWVANRGAYHGYFHADDLDNLAMSKETSPVEYALEVFRPRLTERNYRAAGFVWYSLMWRLAGWRFSAYVASLQILHLLAAWLMWRLLRRLGLDEPAAAAGAVWFALHIAGFDAWWQPLFIFDLLCGLFSVACLLSYVRGSTAWAFLFFWLAVRSKEPALLVPFGLLAYEWLLGERRWRRVLPFLAVSLLFGAHAVWFGSSAGGDYRLSLRPADLWTTVSFYSSKILLVPYAGLALAALPLLTRDRRILFGLALFAILLPPMLVLPGRLFAVYLYAPLAGATIAFAVAAQRLGRWRAAVLGLFFLVWLPSCYAVLKSNRKATLAAADENRLYVSGLAKALARLPEARTFVYEGQPERMTRAGIAGALRLLCGGAVKLYHVEDAGLPPATAGRPLLLVHWLPGFNRMSVLERRAGAPPPDSIRIGPLTPVWHLLGGWHGKSGGYAWTYGVAAAELWRPEGARHFYLRLLVGPEQIERVRHLDVRVALDGRTVGSAGFDKSGWNTLVFDLPEAPAGRVLVEIAATPVLRPQPGNDDELGTAVGGFGFSEAGVAAQDGSAP